MTDADVSVVPTYGFVEPAYDRRSLGDVVPAVAHGIVDALAPWSDGTVPVNFASPQTIAARPGACWDDEARARLVEASRRYDPDGVLGGRRLGLR